MTGRDVPLETVPPLTMKGYTKTFAMFMSHSNQYDIQASSLRNLILKNIPLVKEIQFRLYYI